MQLRLDVDKEKLSNTQQSNRDIRRYGDKNTADFSGINQEAKKLNLNEFSHIAENISTICYRTPMFDVIIDGYRNKLP